MLRAKGLHTFSNFHSEIPEGALSLADNVVIDKDGIIEPRRGLGQYGVIGTSSADIADAVLLYKDRILANYGNKIAWDAGDGDFSNEFPGNFAPTENGLRIKYVESNGNLYITTSDGIQKIAATSAATLGAAQVSSSGAIRALTGSAVPVYGGATFMDPFSKVAYRITWGTVDVNENFLEGFPSPAIEVVNPSSNFASTEITFQIPAGITTDYFYRIYRTNVAVAADFDTIGDVSAGDEMRLVIENGVTASDLLAGSITVADITPETFRDNGVNLYTNEFSGEGILQANSQPPFAKDVALYKNAVFFANTRTKHRTTSTLLGLDGIKRFNSIEDSISISSIVGSVITLSAPHGMLAGQTVALVGTGAGLDGNYTITAVTADSIDVGVDVSAADPATTSIYGSSLTISDGTTPITYVFVGRPEASSIQFPVPASLASSGTADSVTLYSIDDAVKYIFYFKQGTVDAPTAADAVLIEVDITTAVTADDVAAAFAVAADEKTFDLVVDSISTDTVIIKTATNGTSTDTTTTSGSIVITKIQDGQGEDVTNRWVRYSGFVSAAQAIDDTARSLALVINSDPSSSVNAFYEFVADGLPGRITYEARTLDPDAFFISSTVPAIFNPALNNLSSVAEDKPNRIYYSKVFQPEAVPLVNYFDVGPKDKAIKRIVALRDRLFIFKEEGIYSLTGEDSTNYFVAAFDNSAMILAPDTASVLNNQVYALTTQGVVAVSEAGVLIKSRPIENIFNAITSPRYTHFKTATHACSYEADRSYIIWVPNVAEEQIPTRAYRFNTFTQTWTSFRVSANCAVVNPIDNRLYVGAGDTNLIEQERKDLLRTDYADRQYTLSLPPTAFSVEGQVELSSAALVEKGDFLVQTLYLTPPQLLRVARKLAVDPGLPVVDRSFYADFEVANGADLKERFNALVLQLNSDLGSSFPSSTATTFEGLQTDFNAFVDALNADLTLGFSTYLKSEGTINSEMLVQSRLDATRITVLSSQNFIQGDIILYKGIRSEVIWAPIAFGEPSIWKQVREGTIMFDNAGIAFAELGYNTDLSPNFEDIDFLMEGDGSWGVFFYSSTSWGGEGTGRPFRTLIPAQKQRCRYIRPHFIHDTAFYRYGILGVSFTLKTYSSRAYS